MSAIAGIIRFDGGPVEAADIEQMTDAMAHRGPDGIYHHHRSSIALGYCQLCTTTEALEEVQPAFSGDQQRVLVMDGRIDNFEDLRAELTARGAQLRNRSDAELVLGAYDIWGRDCLQHIDGDFAFVIWDDRRQTAFCARDHNGNKPFCYHWDGKTLTFASQVSAILAMPWVKRERNTGMLAEYLANRWYSRSDTLWAGVSRLVAAHAMEVSRDGPKTAQYWQPDLGRVLPCTSDGEYAEYYRALVSKVVQRMTRSHKPVAFEVSGGLDSSALFALFVHLRHQTAVNAPG
ncbi:MAG: asparagine synthase-related protein, partial [Hyphomicrobiales bacterium]|nr:asparagine synthase-related protein [Hyphomicrobiales bacterium]